MASSVTKKTERRRLPARAQHAFNCAEYEKQIALLLRDLAEAKYELARRDTRDARASAPSPSAMIH
jgi:hypothetical protein